MPPGCLVLLGFYEPESRVWSCILKARLWQGTLAQATTASNWCKNSRATIETQIGTQQTLLTWKKMKDRPYLNTLGQWRKISIALGLQRRFLKDEHCGFSSKNVNAMLPCRVEFALRNLKLRGPNINLRFWPLLAITGMAQTTGAVVMVKTRAHWPMCTVGFVAWRLHGPHVVRMTSKQEGSQICTLDAAVSFELKRGHPQ